MSYDVSMSEPECPTCHRFGERAMDENITHNVNGIAEACLAAAGAPEGKGYSWGRLDGLTGVVVLPIAERALLELLDQRNQAAWTQMEPANGWGSRACVQRVLTALVKASREWVVGQLGPPAA